MKENRKIFTIGVLIGNVHSPYTLQLLQGMKEAAREKEVNVLYFLGTHSSYLLESMLGESKETNYDYQFNTIYDYARLGGLDALIVSYGSLCIFLEEMNKDLFLSRFKSVPYLLLEDEEEGETANYMIADNYAGMYQLVEHLLRDHGYTRFVYVSGPMGNKDAQERRKAFLDACAEYGVTIPEDAIEYGDFSEYADEQVSCLLERYPDTQAIVCANDEMASAAYRVSKEKGRIVGRDIAVTGFDNSINAEIVNPPITTVEQSSFNMGYMAIQNAFLLCEGKLVGGMRVPTKFIKRDSCGCNSDSYICSHDCENMSNQEKIQEFGGQMARAVIKTELNRSAYRECQIYTERIMEQILRLKEEGEDKAFQDDAAIIMNIVDEMTMGRLGKYISLIALSKEIARMFSYAGQNAPTLERKAELLDVLTKFQTKFLAYTSSKKDNKLTVFQRKSWFVQMIAREMTENLEVEEKFFLSAISKLRRLGVKSSYIYILDKVIKHYEGDKWNCPEKLYLAAFHAGGEVVSYNQKERPMVNEGQGISQHLKSQDGHQLCAFILFSDERQYGLLLCEIEQDDLSIIYFTSLQIGTALRFLELRNKELEIRNQLQDSFQTIKAKNEVLNFISEYDELTNLLNRRGFMERALMVNQNLHYAGKKAVFIFGDLDHLKEINDRFGHSEGDYAITKAGKLLKQSLHPEAILGRIGGDEFVAMSTAEHYTSMAELKNNIKEVFAAGNSSSCKPYYIEMSIGHFEFTFGEEQDLSAIIKKADELLYHDKKNRRVSVSRD